ncbi:MAG: HAD family hydrolase [Candidatus Peribacteria bacterium]|jgi:putative hydrolase of the HAD superfamily|nr:HAD family hydrolase [Candidatus Peribacteria bacterium]
MGKKLIAFDMYHTCLDVQGEEQIFPFLSEQLSLPKQEIQNTLLTTNITIDEMIQSVSLSPKHKEQLLKKYNHMLQEVISSITTFPETIPTLQALKQQGYKTAVVSNVSTPFIPPINNFLDGYFDYKILSCEVNVAKPQKEIFELLQHTSNIPTKDILMIGDSIKSDVEGAKNAGIDALWINREGKENSTEYPTITNLQTIFEIL